jgi:hypothetical protein
VLLDLQRAFRATVIGDLEPIAPHVAALRGPVARRIAVYRNTVQTGLIDVLAAAYPVVARIVGQRFFHALARSFVTARLPDVPQLSLYGKDFPEFIAAHEAARALTYLPDVARLEWARGEAYFAADADPLDPLRLGAVDPSRIGGIRLRIHPATRLVSSRFPIFRIWSVNQPDVTDVPAVDMTAAEHVIITRPQYHVALREISAADAAFVEACRHNATLTDAAAAALGVAAGFDLQEALQRHLLAGTFTDITVPAP